MARLFGRKKQNTAEHPVPVELEQYYDRGGWRKWVRWIVGIIVVLAVLFGIFLLARTVYRSVTDDGEDKGITTQNESEKQGNKDETKKDTRQDDTSSSDTSNSQNKTTPSQGSGATNPPTVPKTGDDSGNNLPATGDNPTDQAPKTLPSTGG